MPVKRSVKVPPARVASSRSTKRAAKSITNRPDSVHPSDESFGEDSEPTEDEVRGAKRRKRSNTRTSKPSGVSISIFQNGSATIQESCSPSNGRQHSVLYHKPLFLCESRGLEHRQSLLAWFDSVSTTRSMPWRKAWINPSPSLQPDPASLRKQLERRAYEVWISEIMLQQTRVAVVIDYWNRWMGKWPTIQDLAAADPEDVLAAWRGLGYYSRATRIHEASKLVVQDAAMQGLLPSVTTDLEAKVPGVGRYTAGAISAIVFGRAAPMVDGNVLRVLSRQLGIYGNIKTDKKIIDTIWAAADALVKATALDCDDHEDVNTEVSDRPGRWGQALMELGSTICTPKPNCSQCPITASCRVYSEARKMSQTNKEASGITDIEDACNLCEPFEEDIEHDTELKALQETKMNTNSQPDKKEAKPRQRTLTDFSFTGKPTKAPSSKNVKKEAEVQEAISNYARRFPIKTAKKPVRAEETIVCAIQRHDGSYLIHRRPEKGLLAGLWEFPSKIITDAEECSGKQRTELAKSYVASLIGADATRVKPKHVRELGSVPWLFSHLKLTMHVHVFQLMGECDMDAEKTSGGQPARWTDDVEGESMGTGMRKCWGLVRGADHGE
ncbi:hypothetical protein QQS21_009951 [Conoideocrella luteorostrata]|uniref:Adenine DNA glycosylase n=1 Tax=Conoideocrella luteorostrata TaxID=1105319 RepID=A0AAJ0FPV6_9HYPO|nr:hypothetical protein QQS21_009951 [Conoideocrella luteorostrata]